LPELRQIDPQGNPLTHLPAGPVALPRLEKLELRWIATPAARHALQVWKLAAAQSTADQNRAASAGVSRLQ
jgi:hypothetical protein